MSGNQDPRLAIEWENHLAPLRLYQPQSNEQGPLPFISPYYNNIQEHPGGFDAYRHSMNASVSVVRVLLLPTGSLRVIVALHWPSVPANVQ